MALVTVFPVDIHALTGAFLDLNRPWIGSGNGQNARFFSLNAAPFLRGTGLNGFVGHTKSMTLGTQKVCESASESARRCPESVFEVA